MRILHVSDPHFDFDPAGVRDVVLGLLQKGDFDLIACTGDIANNEADCAEFLGWFSDVKVPKFLVPGNHELWWTRRPRTISASTIDDGFAGHAHRNGWTVPDPRHLWQVKAGVLLFNVFYTPEPAWNARLSIAYDRGRNANDLTYSADHRYVYRFEDLVQTNMPEPKDPPEVAFSLSHLSPSDAIRSRYPPQVCFVNNQLLRVAQAHRSPLHLFGHTHEAGDEWIGKTRCVNRSWMDADYKLRIPECGVVFDA